MGQNATDKLLSDRIEFIHKILRRREIKQLSHTQAIQAGLRSCIIAVAFLCSVCVLTDPFNNFSSDSGINIWNLVCWITWYRIIIRQTPARDGYQGASENEKKRGFKKIIKCQPVVFLHNQWSS